MDRRQFLRVSKSNIVQIWSIAQAFELVVACQLLIISQLRSKNLRCIAFIGQLNRHQASSSSKSLPSRKLFDNNSIVSKIPSFEFLILFFFFFGLELYKIAFDFRHGLFYPEIFHYIYTFFSPLLSFVISFSFFFEG